MVKLYSVEYNLTMLQIKRTAEFTDWLDRLKDRTTRTRLSRRLDRAAMGNRNLGDVKPVGEDVYGLRQAVGPGWRMYYVRHGAMLIVMLGGGDKSTQSADIDAAKRLARTLEE